MFPDPPPGWHALQERAKRAENADELARIIDEMNRLLREYEKAAGNGHNVSGPSVQSDKSTRERIA